MKTFGQVLREARKKAALTQREIAAKLKREDGRPVDPPYLNAVEHDHRYPPEDYLIEQMAKIVGVSPDVLYFHANRQPPDVKTEADQERLETAYRAFRKALGVKPPGKRKGSCSAILSGARSLTSISKPRTWTSAASGRS